MRDDSGREMPPHQAGAGKRTAGQPQHIKGHTIQPRARRQGAPPPAEPPNMAQPAYWRALLDQMPLRTGISQAKLVRDLAAYLRAEHFFLLGRINRDEFEKARKRFIATYGCFRTWLDEWAKLLEFFPAAADEQTLAQWLGINPGRQEHHRAS